LVRAITAVCSPHRRSSSAPLSLSPAAHTCIAFVIAYAASFHYGLRGKSRINARSTPAVYLSQLRVGGGRDEWAADGAFCDGDEDVRIAYGETSAAKSRLLLCAPPLARINMPALHHAAATSFASAAKSSRLRALYRCLAAHPLCVPPLRVHQSRLFVPHYHAHAAPICAPCCASTRASAAAPSPSRGRQNQHFKNEHSKGARSISPSRNTAP